MGLIGSKLVFPGPAKAIFWTDCGVIKISGDRNEPIPVIVNIAYDSRSVIGRLVGYADSYVRSFIFRVYIPPLITL